MPGLNKEKRNTLEKAIRNVLNDNPIWKPGVTEVVDEDDREKYSEVMLLPSYNAQSILKNADKEIKNIEDNKPLYYDDISFLERGISALFMQNDVRINYDIFKASIIVKEKNIILQFLYQKELF